MQFFGGSDVSPSLPASTAAGHNANMMYMFNRNGVCLFYREWNRPLHTLNPQQDHKLMFGLLFSLKSLTAKMDPTSGDKANLGMPQLPGQGCSFHSFRTDTYKLSFMESPSGIKIILVTHPKTGDLREATKYIYNLYVEYVAKNPLYTPGTPISFTFLITILSNGNLPNNQKWQSGAWATVFVYILVSFLVGSLHKVRAIYHKSRSICEEHFIDASYSRYAETFSSLRTSYLAQLGEGSAVRGACLPWMIYFSGKI